MPLGDVCYPYRFNYSWMYGFATKRTLACPMAKYGPPPRSLVGSPAASPFNAQPQTNVMCVCVSERVWHRVFGVCVCVLPTASFFFYFGTPC